MRSCTPVTPARQVAFGLTNVTKAMGYAMIVDLSHGVSATARIHSFGSIGLAIGIGHAIGPLLGGLLGAIDPRLTYFASGSVMVRWDALGGSSTGSSLMYPRNPQAIVTVFARFSLPETCSDACRRSFPTSGAGSGGVFGVSLGRAMCKSLRVFGHRPLAPFCAPFVLR